MSCRLTGDGPDLKGLTGHLLRREGEAASSSLEADSVGNSEALLRFSMTYQDNR